MPSRLIARRFAVFAVTQRPIEAYGNDAVNDEEDYGQKWHRNVIGALKQIAIEQEQAMKRSAGAEHAQHKKDPIATLCIQQPATKGSAKDQW